MRPLTYSLILSLSASLPSTRCFLASPSFLRHSTSRARIFAPSMNKDGIVAESSTSTEEEKMLEMQKRVGAADLNWPELGFAFQSTNSHIRMTYRNGEWGKPELVKEPYINIHIGATALHYGQACFEGLKAFQHADGSVHIFRPDENAKRLASSCERIVMPKIDGDVFVDMAVEVVRDNLEFVPPYGSNGALYLRPLLFGSGARIGLQPADEYVFLILVLPVGDYYKGGLASPARALIVEDFDRAAPKGVGAAKVAGNYAADLLPNMQAKADGFPIGLYLDAKTRNFVEEFSTSNFVGINKEQNKYVTPKSPSVLPSITNKSLMTIASKQLGMTVEQRDIPLEEMNEFDEVVACGTAVVVTPIGSVTQGERVFSFGDETNVGEVTRKLYDTVRDIQNGEVEDIYGWNFRVC